MKKIFLLLLIALTITSSISCSGKKEPLVTENAVIPDSFSTVLNSGDALPNQKSWDDWQERVADLSMVVLRVKKLSSSTYYWDDDGVGGITDTIVLVQDVLLGYTNEFDGLSIGEELHLTEFFTVDKEGNTVLPKYNLKSSGSGDGSDFVVFHDESLAPFMTVGEEYIVCMWNGWFVGNYGEMYSLECSVNGGAATIVPAGYYNKGCLRYELYEYGEAAYERSAAIVAEFTAKGESREANSYNFYHSMVKEAYERFSGN